MMGNANEIQAPFLCVSNKCDRPGYIDHISKAWYHALFSCKLYTASPPTPLTTHNTPRFGLAPSQVLPSIRNAPSFLNFGDFLFFWLNFLAALQKPNVMSYSDS